VPVGQYAARGLRDSRIAQAGGVITTIRSMDSGPAPSKSAVADLDNDIAELG
jgi:hypothetical protein